MAIFNWDKTYSIDNEQLDEHHRKFFAVVNELHDIVVGRDQLNSFDHALDELISYTDYHFKAEDQQMVEMNYPGRAEHMAQHEYFTQKLLDFKRTKGDAEFRSRHEFIVFLGEWILHHVVNEDKNLARG